MAKSRATAVWEGDLTSGSGRVSTDTGVLSDAPVSWAARTQRPDPNTSPEELLAAAHAACYAMAFSGTLASAGNAPERLTITAVCHFTPKDGGGFEISEMDLDVRGRVPGLDQAGFEQAAREGEEGCPVSNAIRGNVDIKLSATLET
ncbi:MAG: lipoyl-dependent peroxiredoxin [Gaiellales bacterium]|jgi:osmotically inducible protein OsmC|nr:lipoyl-dependent peroxiredoxin [Gaiellales bacterium]